jgi:hypothetical protein
MDILKRKKNFIKIANNDIRVAPNGRILCAENDAFLDCRHVCLNKVCCGAVTLKVQFIRKW